MKTITTYLLVILVGEPGDAPEAFMQIDPGTKQAIHYTAKSNCNNAGITLQTHRHYQTVYETTCIAVDRVEAE